MLFQLQLIPPADGPPLLYESPTALESPYAAVMLMPLGKRFAGGNGAGSPFDASALARSRAENGPPWGTVRTQAARNLLTTTARTLAEIAVDVGYTDQSHLTKRFREVTGMTPAAYRRQFVVRT